MRLNIRLAGPAESLVENMKAKYGISTKDLILDALALYTAAAETVEAGGEILGKGQNEEAYRFIVPSLEAIKAKGKAPQQQHKKKQPHEMVG